MLLLVTRVVSQTLLGTAAARGLFADDDDDYVDSQHLDQPLSQQEKDQTKQNQPQSATQVRFCSKYVSLLHQLFVDNSVRTFEI